MPSLIRPLNEEGLLPPELPEVPAYGDPSAELPQIDAILDTHQGMEPGMTTRRQSRDGSGERARKGRVSKRDRGYPRTKRHLLPFGTFVSFV